VAVIGCGGVGQAVIQGARIAGAARIIAIDPVELKRTTALQFGATDAIDPTDGGALAQVQTSRWRGAIRVRGDREPQDNPAGVRDDRAGGACIVVGVPRFDQTSSCQHALICRRSGSRHRTAPRR